MAGQHQLFKNVSDLCFSQPDTNIFLILEIHMSKKNSAIKNIITAHGWLGVTFSILLFVVFWAGSLSLFRAEIEQWAELPHYPVSFEGEDKSLSELITPQIIRYDVNLDKPLRVFLSNDDNFSYRLNIELSAPKNNRSKEKLSNSNKVSEKPIRGERLRLKIDPKTGLARESKPDFELIDFIYELHYNLQLSRFGLYLIGVVTLFLLFALLSGVFVHAKKITHYFFSHRIHKVRTQLLDMHNVVGIMSLPFTLMYALTGLVFNLIIVYQIAFVVFIYQGDQEAMLNDAGFGQFTIPTKIGVSQDMSAIDKVLAQTEQQYGQARFLRLYNYGDETAVMQVQGGGHANFEPRYQLYIRIHDGVVLKETGVETLNAFKEGRRVLSSLHFGDFAGFDLRVLYFILGLAVTAMIVTGNMLWINKRNNNAKASVAVTTFVSNLTLGICCGMVLATAVGLLLERALPLTLAVRANWVIGGFMGTTVVVVIYAFWVVNKKDFIANTLYATAATLLATIAASWILFSSAILELWAQGIQSVIGVEVGILLSALLCLITARYLR